MSHRDPSIEKKSKKTWNASLRDLVADLLEHHNVEVSTSTVSRCFSEVGITSCYAVRKPLLNNNRKSKRVILVVIRTGALKSGEKWNYLMKADSNSSQIDEFGQLQCRNSSLHVLPLPFSKGRVMHGVGLHNK